MSLVTVDTAEPTDGLDDPWDVELSGPHAARIASATTAVTPCAMRSRFFTEPTVPSMEILSLVVPGELR